MNWFFYKKALARLAYARIGLDAGDDMRLGDACHFISQALELSLTGALVNLGVPFQFKHEVRYLLECLPEGQTVVPGEVVRGIEGLAERIDTWYVAGEYSRDFSVTRRVVQATYDEVVKYIEIIANKLRVKERSLKELEHPAKLDRMELK